MTGRIYYIMGKSATGKDTIYKELLRRRPDLKTIVPYTTRPIREGEEPGVEYFFSSPKELKRFLEEGKVIELRTYQTVHGPWSYFTVDDGQFEAAEDAKYLMIGTLESYGKMRLYFGRENLIPIYIEVPNGCRFHRAIERERLQKVPCYREVCRRYLADEEDFSEDNLGAMEIGRRFLNLDLETCLKEIGAEIE